MHVIDTLAVGGAERMLVDIVNCLDSQRFNPSVCVTRNNISLVNRLKPDIPYAVLERKNTVDPNGFFRLKNFSREQKTDLFHAHGRSSFSFLATAKMLGFINKPIILHDHFGEIETNRRVPSWFPLTASRYLDHYIGVCQLLGEWAKSAGIHSKNISVIENAIDLTRFGNTKPINIRSIYKIPENQKICLMVGNLRPAKGLDLLIDASAQIPKEELPAFIIIGKDAELEYTRQCKEKIKQKKLVNYYHFIGQQIDSIPWMMGADLAVMPSRSESGPLVLIEYLANGLPFVAFNVGGISHQINQVLPDQFADSENVEMFASCLTNLLSMDHEELDSLVISYKTFTSKMFDIQNRMPALESIYYKVLQDSK